MTLSFPRIPRRVLIIASVCILAIFAGLVLVEARKDIDLSTNKFQQEANSLDSKPKLSEAFSHLPLTFEINKGQVDETVKFLAHGDSYDLFLTSSEAVLRVESRKTVLNVQEPAGSAIEDASIREGSVLRLKMLGANTSPEVQGQDELPGKVNYFIGNDPQKWRRNIPTYRRAYFQNIYPGIDAVYYGKQGEFEYDLIIASGADPKLIRFSIEGAEHTGLDKTGELRLQLSHGTVFLKKPTIYQVNPDGSRVDMGGRYVIKGNEVRFKLGRYDSSKTLVIDPVLSYSTLLGSSSNDIATGIAVDSQGSAYVTGTSDFTTFPTTPGAFKTSVTRGGAFVTKLDSTGSSLLYSTYISGGSNGTSNGLGIAVDSAGNAHITGTTNTADFPTVNGLKTTSSFYKTADAAANWNNQNSGLIGDVNLIAVAQNAANTIYASTTDGFYRSTDAGATWTKATATGLSSPASANALAVDPTDASVVYVGNFSGLFRSANGGNNWNQVTLPVSFITVNSIVFDPVMASTMYVGSSNGVFKSTDTGSTWVTQNNFNISGTPGVRVLAIDPTAPLTIYAGTFNNGLFKSINGGGVWTAMNTGMGGPSPTSINAIAIDPANTATIYTGHGSSGGINKSSNGATSWTPLTNDVPQNQTVNAMVVTSTAVYAAFAGSGVLKTTNGGVNWTSANTGLASLNVRTLVRHQSDSAILYAGTSFVGGSDAFVTKLNPAGSGLLFSTLLGGSGADTGNGIALDGSGNILVAGETSSLNFPTVNAAQSAPTSADNCHDGFVTKLNPSIPSYVFSTYLRGNACDTAFGVATDTAGNVYVTGNTASPDFLTSNAFQPALGGGFFGDAFVTKLTTNGALIYSTYLGGSNQDSGQAIAADSAGNAYITGSTGSSNFPTVNAIQPTNSGASLDAFVTKLNSQGSALIYSTYLGGTSGDSAQGIALDSANNAYVLGTSNSVDFPLVVGALRTRSPIYKSTDSAANWSNDNFGFGGLPPGTSVSITSLIIHPTDSSTIYSASGAGVFKSTNGGRTWAAKNNGLASLSIGWLVIDPLTPSTLYALAVDFGNNRGVYKSIDGGNTWVRRSNGLNGTELNSLVIDPVTPSTLYCNSFGRPFKTTDGGDNWVSTNAPTIAATTLAIDPLNHSVLYLADAATPGGFFKSSDAGATWQSLGSTVVFVRSIACSPLTAGLVYAATDQGIFRSADGANSWSSITSRTGKIVFDPVSASTVYLLSNIFTTVPEGLLRSTDNGQTWTPLNTGLRSAQPTALVIDRLKPSTLYLGLPTGFNNSDAFVTKINSAGSALTYSTLVGGSVTDLFTTNPSSQGSGIALDSSGNAYIAGWTSSQGFQTTTTAYQPINRGGNDAFISKLGMSFNISGHVMNSAIPVGGAEVVLSDGGSIASVLTENDGSYQFPRLREGGNYTVSASKSHFSMTPASQTFTNLSSDQVLEFSATTDNSPFFTISGQITENGVGVRGVVVTLSGSQSGLRTTDSSGNYSFELINGGSYTVTPAVLGFTFGPTSQTFNNLNANQSANFTANRQSFVVTNANNHGSGSLRDAIINANATIGTDTITFNIPGPGVKTLNLLTALPEITERVVLDATSQPGYAGTPLIEIDGLTLSGNPSGLVVKAGGSTVRGLAVGNFRNGGGGIVLSSDNNLIQANYLGLAADGTTARPNTRGIFVNNSSNNVIGGTTSSTRNVISGNSNFGVDISGNSNTILGNFIGTNAAGIAAIQNGGTGVFMSSTLATDNRIGGTDSGAGNLISGNQTGITCLSTTRIQGNLIGTDVTGTKKIANTNGILAFGSNILIGGLTPGARNVISGNSGEAVNISGGAGNKVQGNYIGTDGSGTAALGNSGNGISAKDNVLIGGIVPEARNIISANGGSGNIVLGSTSSGTLAATVQGNYIGTDVNGVRALTGTGTGIAVFNSDNVIGGTIPGARNVISGNSIGVQLGLFSGANLSGNVIQGNFVGLDALGTRPVPNTQSGIAIVGGANNTIGGIQAGAGNKIAFNNGPGVSAAAGVGNAIRGNSIFSNGGLGIDLLVSGTTGVTANDMNDGDSGPNNLQNFPVITSLQSSANSTNIHGSLNSIPLTTFQLDFYASAAVDPSGNGEGAQLLNSASITTNQNGDATIDVTFAVALPAGRVITATATDPNGNTSEFSAVDSTNAAGSIQFSLSSIQVIEDIGVISLTAVRTGGSSGDLTVDYSTVDGTATAGQDYTFTAGTLTFLSGETSKTIQIPILDDATTEPDERFTVELRNTLNPESLGSPSVVIVSVQDHSTIPSLAITNATIVEGGAGTTTDLSFTISISAGTGRAVTGNYVSSNLTGSGGASCNNPGVDFETTSGTFSFNPGSTTFKIRVKICGDNNAEANETFRITLSNFSGASPVQSIATGTITNDDALELALEESGPLPDQAAALDALLTLRDPFRVAGIPDWWFPNATDKNRRIALFARNLQLNPGELSSAVIVRFTNTTQLFEVAAESVRPVPNTDLTQVVARLPNNLATGNCSVFIRAHTIVSNTGSIRIAP